MFIVSDKFNGLSKVQKHRLVHSSLGEIMGQVHAITLTCQTQEEVENKKGVN